MDAEKDYWQNVTFVKDKNSENVGLEEPYLNLIKFIYDKHTTDIILSEEKLKPFPLNLG